MGWRRASPPSEILTTPYIPFQNVKPLPPVTQESSKGEEPVTKGREGKSLGESRSGGGAPSRCFREWPVGRTSSHDKRGTLRKWSKDVHLPEKDDRGRMGGGGVLVAVAKQSVKTDDTAAEGNVWGRGSWPQTRHV